MWEITLEFETIIFSHCISNSTVFLGVYTRFTYLWLVIILFSDFRGIIMLFGTFVLVYVGIGVIWVSHDRKDNHWELVYLVKSRRNARQRKLIDGLWGDRWPPILATNHRISLEEKDKIGSLVSKINNSQCWSSFSFRAILFPFSFQLVYNYIRGFSFNFSYPLFIILSLYYLES